MPVMSVPSAVSQVAPAGSPPALGSIDQNGGGNSRIVPAVALDFEAYVLQSFIEAMLPENTGSVLGTGTAGAFWKSMLAEQVAGELARTGGIGIACLIEPDLLARSGVTS